LKNNKNMTEKSNQISERLSALRKFMKTRHLDAFIVPSTDPHLSEYPPKRWECRKWITGFTGSAGTAVITMKQAGVWTDSRYFLQAASVKSGQPENIRHPRRSNKPEIQIKSP
jgi:hypothetical protein